MFTQALNCDNNMPFGLCGQHGTPIDRFAVQQYCVSTGKSLLIAEFDPVEAKSPQSREQSRRGRCFNCVFNSVDLECNVHGNSFCYKIFVTSNPRLADSSAFCEPKTATEFDCATFSSTSPKAMKSSPLVVRISSRVFCLISSVRWVR